MEQEEQQLTKKERRALHRREREEVHTQYARRRTVKRIALWLGVFAILGGAVWGVLSLSKTSSQNGQGAVLLDAVSQGENIRGSTSAPAVLVEYSDFQCPACATFYPVIKELKEVHGDKLTFVYRHFPLRRIHSNAEPAARAAEAAGLQGKFWEMHDLIFEHQRQWASVSRPQNIFKEYAASLGLNVEQFEREFDADQVKDRVKQDEEYANRMGLDSTPTLFLNGEKITVKSLEQFRALIAASVISDSSNDSISPSPLSPDAQ